MKTLFFIFRRLPQKGRFFLCGLLLAAEMGSVLLTPALLQALYDQQNTHMYLAALVFCSLLIVLGSLGQSRIYQQGIHSLRTDLWRRHLHTPLLQMRSEGEAFTLLVDDVDKAMIFLQGFTAASLFRSLIYVVVATVVLWTKSLMVLGIAVCVSLVSMGIIAMLARKRKKAAAMQRQSMAGAAEVTAEMIAAREEIWAFGQEQAFMERYGRVSAEVTRARRRSNLWAGLSDTVSGFVDVAAQPLAIWFGFWLGAEEGLLLLAGYAAVLVKGCLSMMMFWNNAQGGVPSGQRIREVLEDD